MGKTNAADWTPKKLEKAVTAGTQEEKVALLKKLGILTASGKTAKASEKWGTVTRTPTFEESSKVDTKLGTKTTPAPKQSSAKAKVVTA